MRKTEAEEAGREGIGALEVLIWASQTLISLTLKQGRQSREDLPSGFVCLRRGSEGLVPFVRPCPLPLAQKTPLTGDVGGQVGVDDPSINILLPHLSREDDELSTKKLFVLIGWSPKRLQTLFIHLTETKYSGE